MSTSTEETKNTLTIPNTREVNLPLPSGGECTLHIMDGTGDTRIMWDPRIPAEVAAAKAAFDAAKTGGMLAYTVDPNSGEKTGTVIREFDETAGKIIMAPQLVGG